MRVTEPAQKAVRYAQTEAGRLGQDHVATEHLLLSLLHDEEYLALAVLGELGLAPERARRGSTRPPARTCAQRTKSGCSTSVPAVRLRGRRAS